MSLLSPYRVIDLTTERGMLCGALLADMGADVIQVEPPGGSPVRKLGPFAGDQRDPNRSLYFWSYNRNKRAITLDLERESGRALLKRLCASADFLIESFDPGYLAARGLGPADLAALNARLIYVSISPFGQDGPKAGYAASDLVLMASGGPLILAGDDDRPPVRVSVPQAYSHACADAVVAALAAHHERVRSGQGQQIDVAAQTSVAIATQAGILAAALGSIDGHRYSGGLKMGPIEIPMVWPARDGYVVLMFLFGSALGVFARKLMHYICAQGLCDEKMRDKDWIGYGQLLATGQEPLTEFERAKDIIRNFTRQHTKAELLEIAMEQGLLITPVTTIEDVVESPQLAARDYWQSIEHLELDRTISYPGAFAKFSASPVKYTRRPPLVGEHNREILGGELKLSEEQLKALARDGAI